MSITDELREWAYMPRRRFADAAGYTRHCWECSHAKGWKRVNTIDGHEARCELAGVAVGKYDSPNNPCSHLPKECDWSEA